MTELDRAVDDGGCSVADSRRPDDDPAALRDEIHQLHRAMATRAVIEQAKGALMLRFGVDADRAFAILVRWSQDSNIKLHTVATTLIDAVSPGDPSASADPVLVGRLQEQLSRGAASSLGQPSGQADSNNAGSVADHAARSSASGSTN